MNARRYPAAAVLCAAVLVAGAFARPAAAATPAEVEAAIKKGKQFLYGLQRPEGRWEPDAERKGNVHHDHPKMQGQAWGGYTACAVYALLAAGESPQEPRLAKGIEFLKKADITGVYAIGVRSQVWLHLPPSAETRRLAKRDAEYLINQLNVAGPGIGGWDYDDITNQAKRPTGGRIDHSVSQYGVLALWACARAGHEIDPRVWTALDNTWKSHQWEDGGWSYDSDGKGKGGPGQPTASMTAAGVATLFITQDFLRANDGVNCRGNVTNDHIEKGLRWMANHFDEVRNNNYAWYGVERIGVASGYKYFGTTDWYAAGADELVKQQSKDGSWRSNFPGATPIPDTAFAMLFLSRGRAPVVMNKLDYSPVVGANPEGGEQQPARKNREVNWNQRPRDAANLAGWIATQTERDLNWQIVNLSASAEDLHDAPILYVAGSEGLDFSQQDVEKLRAFVEQGGLILGNADCGKEIFNRAFRRLGSQMFPKYEFRDLPADHAIYTEQTYQASKWKNKPKVQGLSNGVRELMLLLPDGDAGRAWQTRADRTREELFQLGANVFLYAIDRQNLRVKGETYVVRDKGGPTDKSLKVARLTIGDNPDPEPGGWRRLATVLKNDHKVALAVEPAAADAKLSAAGAKVAHLTGTGKFKLDNATRQELIEFVKNGGTLVVDAAGGSTPFADAAEAELAAMFGQAWTEALKRPLPPDHPVYNVPGVKVEQFRYRQFARKMVGELRGPRVRGVKMGDRVGVFYSREDLSAGLVGQPVDGIIGYDVNTATPVMRSILLYAMVDGDVAKLAPPPEQKPGEAKKADAKPEEKKPEEKKPVEDVPF